MSKGSVRENGKNPTISLYAGHRSRAHIGNPPTKLVVEDIHMWDFQLRPWDMPNVAKTE